MRRHPLRGVQTLMAHDHHPPTAPVLNRAAHGILGALSTGTNALSQAWSDLGHRRFRDTETHSK